MRRVGICVLAMLCGPLAGVAHADHPADGEAPALTPAVERVLGPETTQGQTGLFKVPLDDGTVLRTHGPDPRAAAGEGLGLGEAFGPSDRFLPGSSERAPICATDNAMQVLYARGPATPDRLAASASDIQSTVRRTNYILNQEAIASGGGGGDYKVVCSGGDIDVKPFITVGTTFNQVVDAAKAAGFQSSTRNYAIFLDESAPGGYCGVGSLYFSDTPSLSNPHNTNGGYSVIYKPCWNGTTFMHEVGHNRGAVQPDAPNSTGEGAHCNQGHDVMCYAPDGGNRNQTMTYPCSAVTLFDCGYDDYFDAAPEPDEYLASHWNLGTPGQSFLVIDPTAGEPAPEPEPDITSPETEITAKPVKRTRQRSARFEFTGTDAVSAPEDLAFECSLDGAGFGPCLSPRIYKSLSRTRHRIEVRATDEAGNVDLIPASYRWNILR